MKTTHLPYWLAATYLPEVGPRTFLRWLTHFENIEALFEASDNELKSKGFSDVQRRSIQKGRSANQPVIDSDMQWAQSAGQHIITLVDEAYPPLLKEIADPPLVLFVRGDKDALLCAQIAMVGSRNATVSGLKTADMLAGKFIEAGLVVTSGLAMGIDGACHRGAVAKQGVTIGVMGTGLHHIYPRSHKKLVDDILMQGGALVSEFPLATQPLPANFPRRNRLIAGLSLGVLVVEAMLKSGSLITARLAMEYGREVFAVPGSIHNPLTKGCHHLLRQGATLVESVDDVIAELGSLISVCRTSVQTVQELHLPNLSKRQSQLLEQIEYEITSMDVILLRSGLTAGELSSILLTLELNGYIQSVPGGYVRAIHDK